MLAARSYEPVDYRTPIFALDIVCILMTIWFLCDEIAELKRWIFHKLGLYYYSGPRYISRFFFIYFTVTGVKKIVRYTKDFIIQRFVISRFHCIISKV